jgi:hypothetical protein
LSVSASAAMLHIALLLLACTVAQAQPVESFYRGKPST